MDGKVSTAVREGSVDVVEGPIQWKVFGIVIPYVAYIQVMLVDIAERHYAEEKQTVRLGVQVVVEAG